MRRCHLLLLVCLFGSAMATEVAARDMGPSGKWARSPSQCGRPQSHPDAPTIITAKGLDQHEAHCAFDALKPGGKGRWTARGSCSVQGDVTKGRFAFKLERASLSVTFPDGNTLAYKRC